MDLSDIEVDTLAVFHMVGGSEVTLALTKEEFENVIRWLEKKAGQLLIRKTDRVVVIITSQILWAEWLP